MSGLLGLRRLRRRDRAAPVVFRGDFTVHGFPVHGQPAAEVAMSAASVDRYRLAQEREAETVAFVLDGIGVGSLSELNRLVGLGRIADGLCAVCSTERWQTGDGYACVNASCPRFDPVAWRQMLVVRDIYRGS